MGMSYEKLEMQYNLLSEDIQLTNDERKFIFQLRTSMNLKIKSHIRRMHDSVLCKGCHLEESNTKHTLQCNILMGRNDLVTYIPDVEDLYGDNEDEQVYKARLIKDNMETTNMRFRYNQEFANLAHVNLLDSVLLYTLV